MQLETTPPPKHAHAGKDNGAHMPQTDTASSRIFDAHAAASQRLSQEAAALQVSSRSGAKENNKPAGVHESINKGAEQVKPEEGVLLGGKYYKLPPSKSEPLKNPFKVSPTADPNTAYGPAREEANGEHRKTDAPHVHLERPHQNPVQSDGKTPSDTKQPEPSNSDRKGMQEKSESVERRPERVEGSDHDYKDIYRDAKGKITQTREHKEGTTSRDYVDTVKDQNGKVTAIVEGSGGKKPQDSKIVFKDGNGKVTGSMEWQAGEKSGDYTRTFKDKDGKVTEQMTRKAGANPGEYTEVYRNGKGEVTDWSERTPTLEVSRNKDGTVRSWSRFNKDGSAAEPGTEPSKKPLLE